MALRVNGHQAAPANGVDDRLPVWNLIEEQYWASTKAVRDREDAERQGAYKARTAAIADETGTLHKERRRLLERLDQIEKQTKANEDKLEQAILEFEHVNAVLSHERAAKDEAKRLEFARQRAAPSIQAGPGFTAQEAAGVDRGAAASAPVTRVCSPSAMSDHRPVPPPLNGYHNGEADTGHSSATNGDTRDIPQRDLRPASLASDAPRRAYWDPTLQRQQLEQQQRSRNSVQHLIGSTTSSTPISRMSMEPATALPSHANGASVGSTPVVGDVAAAQAINGRSAGESHGEFNLAGAGGAPYRPPTDWYKGEPTGIQVLAGNGSALVELHDLRIDDPSVHLVNRLRSQRNVELRNDIPGFDAQTLENLLYSRVFEAADSRPGSRWLACLIQATGRFQDPPCYGCAAGHGVFRRCVRLEGRNATSLPRCANCEWENHPCDTRAWEHPPEDQAPFVSSVPTQVTSVPVAGGFTAVNAPSATKTVGSRETSGEAASSDRTPLPGHAPGLADATETYNVFTGTPSRVSKGRKSLPSERHPSTTPAEGVLPTPDMPARPKAPRRKKDANPLSLQDAEAVEAEKQARWKELELDTINKDTLLLKDDGKVYTEPELMRGVPLEKISPDHPYWDPAWPLLEELTKPQLEKWQEKYQKHVDDPNLPQSSKFLAGRQVNRGKQILDFLENGSIHPYQIVAKSWVGKGLANYDVVYRLINTLQDLVKYKIDMEPHQWLRMRLHEIYEENRPGFNLVQVVQNLYHDKKIQGIRERSGHGSIGRPSGYNMGAKKVRKSDGVTKTPRGQKRKEHPEAFAESFVEAVAGTETESHQQEGEHGPASEQGNGQGQETVGPASESPQAPAGTGMERRSELPGPGHGMPAVETSRSASPSTTQKKQQKTDSSQQATNAPKHEVTTEEDLAYDGYTTVDSFSGDPVLKIDFRLDQVRTSTATTNKGVTQYWHWITGAGEFQHQLLSNIRRNAQGKVVQVSWGVYKDHNFHMHTPDVLHVAWAPGTLTIVIHKREAKEARRPKKPRGLKKPERLKKRR